MGFSFTLFKLISRLALHWLILFIFAVKMINSSIYSIPEIHLAPAEAQRATMITSELGFFIRTSVRAQFEKIYNEPESNAKYLIFIDKKGGRSALIYTSFELQTNC